MISPSERTEKINSLLQKWCSPSDWENPRYMSSQRIRAALHVDAEYQSEVENYPRSLEKTR